MGNLLAVRVSCDDTPIFSSRHCSWWMTGKPPLHGLQLGTLHNFVREGDTVFCHSMDRLARNLDDLRRIVLGLTERGVHIVFVKENLTFTGEDSPTYINFNVRKPPAQSVPLNFEPARKD